MTDVFRNPDPEAESLRRIRGERGAVDLVADRFHPRKLKKWTNVGNTTGGKEDGLPMVKRGVGDAIKNASHATHAKEPKFGW